MKQVKKILTVSILLTLSFLLPIKAQKINRVDSEGKRIGIWKKYYDNGNIRYEGQFKKGKEVGIFKFYGKTTAKYPAIVKEFSEIDGTAQVKFLDHKGKVKSKGVMLGRNRIEKWLYYFPDGKIISEEITMLMGN
jgi:inner membrane protein involved in colicin E2 resistance